jgi:hypothetical protein
MLSVLVIGCITHYEASMKDAFMMYQERKADLGPPKLHREQYNNDEGRDRFVEDLCLFVRSNHRAEAIYCIGWFGDRRHARVISPALEDPDAEVRRVALAAFCGLTRREFDDPKEALGWWEENETSFPVLRKAPAKW